MSDTELTLYGTPDLLELPDPEWLIEGVIPDKGFIALYGAPGSGKSFIAVDIAMSVASGIPWQGHELVQGPVLYISAEGGRGIAKRVRAWLQHHKLEPVQADMLWYLNSLNLAGESDDLETLVKEIAAFTAEDDQGWIEDWNPKLIVVDTLARCFIGDENLQEDMGAFVRGIDRLREEFNCAVLVVHHSRLDGGRERGSTVFRGAADTMMKVEVEKNGRLLTCDKQKDSEEFTTIRWDLEQVEGCDSCVVETLARIKDNTASKVQAYAKEHPEASQRDIAREFQISQTTVFRYLDESDPLNQG